MAHRYLNLQTQREGVCDNEILEHAHTHTSFTHMHVHTHSTTQNRICKRHTYLKSSSTHYTETLQVCQFLQFQPVKPRCDWSQSTQRVVLTLASHPHAYTHIHQISTYHQTLLLPVVMTSREMGCMCVASRCCTTVLDTPTHTNNAVRTDIHTYFIVLSIPSLHRQYYCAVWYNIRYSTYNSTQNVCMYVRTHYTHAYTYIYIHTHTGTYVHIQAHTYTYMHIRTHTCTYVYTHKHTYIHTHTYVHIHTYT